MDIAEVTPLIALPIEDDTDFAKFSRTMLMDVDSGLTLTRTQRLDQALDRLAQATLDVTLDGRQSPHRLTLVAQRSQRALEIAESLQPAQI